MKYIFLDIKNVLNLPKTHEKLRNITNKSELFFNDIYSLGTMVNLREICIFAYAFIVLTDDKIVDPLVIKKFKSNLAIYDIEQYYKGTISLRISTSKALRIKNFIDTYKPTDYIILTSDRTIFNDFNELKDNAIRIDKDKGITKALKNQIINKLTVPIKK